MPTLHSHTHGQAAQAHAKTQSWQSVCLPVRRTKMTDKPLGKKEHRIDNIIYTQAGVSNFGGQESPRFKVQFFVGSSVVNVPACE